MAHEARYDAFRDLGYIREAKERAIRAVVEGKGKGGLTRLESSFYEVYVKRVIPMTSSNHVQRVQGDR
jgi:hypothetical protein